MGGINHEKWVVYDIGTYPHYSSHQARFFHGPKRSEDQLVSLDNLLGFTLDLWFQSQSFGDTPFFLCIFRCPFEVVVHQMETSTASTQLPRATWRSSTGCLRFDGRCWMLDQFLGDFQSQRVPPVIIHFFWGFFHYRHLFLRYLGTPISGKSHWVAWLSPSDRRGS